MAFRERGAVWRATIAGMMMAVCLAAPARSWATTFSNTVGGSIASAETSFPAIELFFGSLCMLLGIIMVGSGLLVLKQGQEEHLAADMRFRPTKALMKIAIGAMLVAIPDTMNVGVLTILNVHGGPGALNESPGVVQACQANASNASTIACVAQNVGMNVVPVAMTFLTCGAVIVGGFIILKSFMALGAGDDHARRGPNLLMQAAIGFLLCNVTSVMYLFQNTFGFTNGVATANGTILTGGSSVPAILTYTPDSSIQMLKDFATMISWSFVTISLFGMISFLRGIGKLYTASSGQGGAREVSGGLIHMIFGVACSNVKVTTCWLLMSTLGNGQGFCS